MLGEQYKSGSMGARDHHSIFLHRAMQAAILLTVASLAAVLGAKPEEVKTSPAAAHYGGGYGGGRPQYGPAYSQPGFWQPLLQDRFVCDLDASVLLVVDHNRHHHRNHYFGTQANRAVRVKCSEVANNDEDSCNFCCQQTARRDTSLANDKLFGFLAITKDDDDKTFTRTKRGAEEPEEEPEDDVEELDEDRRRRGGFHKVDPNYVVQAKWTPGAYDTNVKCVCCAPRTAPVAQAPPTYGNAAQSPPANTYGNAAQSPPANTYGNAAQPVTQPQPVAAAQPLMDSWQSDSVAPVSNSWGAAADAAPAVTPAPANAY